MMTHTPATVFWRVVSSDFWFVEQSYYLGRVLGQGTRIHTSTRRSNYPRCRLPLFNLSPSHCWIHSSIYPSTYEYWVSSSDSQQSPSPSMSSPSSYVYFRPWRESRWCIGTPTRSYPSTYGVLLHPLVRKCSLLRSGSVQVLLWMSRQGMSGRLASVARSSSPSSATTKANISTEIYSHSRWWVEPWQSRLDPREIT